MLACRYSNTDSTENTVKILVESGVNLDLKNNYNVSSLMLYFCEASIDGLEYYLSKCKNINREELENFITEYTIPLYIYDYLVDKNIIKTIDIDNYSKSKHNIKIPLKIIENYEIKLSECMISYNTRKSIICNSKHSTCFICLNIMNHECQGCQQEL